MNSMLGIQIANLKPHRFTVLWNSGCTLSPAHIYIKGLNYKVRTRTTDVLIEAEYASGGIHILPLFSRRLVIDNINTALSYVELKRGPDRVPPPVNKSKPNFTFELRNIELERIDKLAFNEVTLSQGQATAKGSVMIQPRGESEIQHFQASWQQAKIRFEGKQTDDTINIETTLNSERFRPRQHRGVELMRKLSGDIRVDGIMRSLAPLQVLFPKAKWIESMDGVGTVALDLQFERGVLLPSSAIDVKASNLDLQFLGYRASGAGRLDGRVNLANGKQRSELSIVFDRFSLARQLAASPLISGKGLSLKINARELGATTDLNDVHMVLDIPQSEFPDVTSLSSNFPRDLGLNINGGDAVLVGHVETKGAKQEVSGFLSLKATSLRGNFRDMDYQLDMDLDARLSGRRLNEFKVALDGSQLKLFNAVINDQNLTADNAWWMNVSAPSGQVKLSRPASLTADLDLSMKDSRAIIAIFAEIKEWLEVFENVLSVDDVRGTAKILASEKNLSLRDIDIKGDNFKLLAQSKIDSEQRKAILWAKKGLLSIGVKRADKKTKWTLVNTLNWYQENKEQDWSGTN